MVQGYPVTDPAMEGWWLQQQGFGLKMLPEPVVDTNAPTVWFWGDKAIDKTKHDQEQTFNMNAFIRDTLFLRTILN